MNPELHPLIASSADPTKVAVTVKGILVALLPVAIYVAKQHGLDFSSDAAKAAIENGLQAGGALISSVMILFGLARKVYYWINRSSA